MLDQILNLVKQAGQQSVVENNEVPDDLNGQIMAEAANTVTSGFQNLASGGGLQAIISLFTGAKQNQGNGSILSNPVVSMMIGHFANKLMSRMNLSPAVANNIANNVIPNVINGMVSRTVSNDPQNDGFDLNDLVASLTGGNAANDNRQTNGIDFQGLLDQFTGGQEGSSGVDIGAILNTVTQRAQQHQQSQQQGGGLSDLITGFFR